MSGTAQEVANVIKGIVASGGPVSGSRLSAALKLRIPGWSPANFSARSLREFVATQVPGVIVAGRFGMDVMYALEGEIPVSAPSVPDLSTQVDFWRVWVSPNSPHSLAVDRTGVLRAVARGKPVESGHLLLEPPGADVHREVARAFLPQVPADLQLKLRGVLSSESEQWWQAWVRELRGTEHIAPWTAFRRQKLEEHLSSQLRSAALAQPVIDEVLRTVRERRPLASPRTRRVASEASQLQDDEAKLRRIVTDAVQHMSLAELRELRVPVGLLLDALAASRSR